MALAHEIQRKDIETLIPHRAPFLLLDRVTEMTDQAITAHYELKADDELWSGIYTGHYPGNPITPGVLLCEMVFQAAAVLMAKRLEGDNAQGVPVIARIREAKFRNKVLPGDNVEIRATLIERMGQAFMMKGGVWKDGKEALRVEFSVAMG